MSNVKSWPIRGNSRFFTRAAAKLFILLSAIFFTVILFPFLSTTPEFDLPHEGDIAQETVIAPFSFDIEKQPSDLERERADAASKVLLVLDFNPDAAKLAKKKIIELRTAIYSFNSSGAMNNPQAVFSADIPEGAIKIIKKSPAIVDEALSGLSAAIDRGILARRIISPDQSWTQPLGNTHVEAPPMLYDKDLVILRRNSGDSPVRWSDIPTRDRAVDNVMNSIRNASQYDTADAGTMRDLLLNYASPDIFINDAETALRRERSIQDVLPIKGKVIQETELVRKHQVITADVVEKLYSLRKAQERQNESGADTRIRSHNLADFILLIMISLFFAAYIGYFHSELLTDNKKIMAIAGILIVQAAIIRLGLAIDTRVIEAINGSSVVYPEYIIPVTVGSILAAIFFDLRISCAVTIFIAVYSGLAMSSSPLIILMTMSTGFTAGFVTRDIRYRFDFVKSVPPVFAIYAVMIFISSLLGGGMQFSGFLQNLVVALINCSLAVFFAMVLTMIFEWLFDIASNMTLIELADMNNPVLKRLSIEAAGTYNHCVLVGNLAESAAERIGANSLFARVASYYHDIGKIEKASYFIENMTVHERSKHTKLSPNLSALIISSHVKDGVELARKYKLPRVIRDAIMQHHGTSTVSYFYEKAREQNPDNPVEEEQFRYPGPLPQTRENAIIMLADSVEAASRSLATSSPKLLRDLVKKIIRDKFTAAQLDQSNLTLRDLDEIVEGFMPILQGIFHTRDPKNKER
jgi:cyclic-di-AMP phosphodiesterase PgpH